MNSAALVTMILVLTAVWGGLATLVLTAVWKDRKRKHRTTNESRGKKNPVSDNIDQ